MQRCQRVHQVPVFSPTVMLPRLWDNPKSNRALPNGKSSAVLDEEFKAFFTSLFKEVAEFGEVEDLVVVR